MRSIHAVIVPKICSQLPSQVVLTAKLPLNNQVLDDSEYYKPNNIDLVLLCEENFI